MYELWAVCAATGANMEDPSYTRYWLTVHPSGSSTCTCLDWISRGGACKHLRAFRLIIEGWDSAGKLQHKFVFPQTQEEALYIQDQNRLWYGASYEDAVTLPAVEATSAIARPTTPESLQITSTHVPLQPINVSLPSVEQQARLEMDIETLSNMQPDVTLESQNFSVNKSAVDIQIQQRFQHYISQTLPILHGFNTLLDDSLPIPTTEGLDDFISTLGILSEKLQSVELESPAGLQSGAHFLRFTFYYYLNASYVIPSEPQYQYNTAINTNCSTMY